MDEKLKVRSTTKTAAAVAGATFFGTLTLQGYPVIGRTFTLSLLFSLFVYSLIWFLLYSLILPLIFASAAYFSYKERVAKLEWLEEQLDILNQPASPTPPATKPKNRPEPPQNRPRTVPEPQERMEPFRNEQQWGKLATENVDMYATRLKTFRASSESNEAFAARLLANGVNRTTIRRVIGGNAQRTSRMIEQVSREVQFA